MGSFLRARCRTASGRKHREFNRHNFFVGSISDDHQQFCPAIVSNGKNVEHRQLENCRPPRSQFGIAGLSTAQRRSRSLRPRLPPPKTILQSVSYSKHAARRPFCHPFLVLRNADIPPSTEERTMGFTDCLRSEGTGESGRSSNVDRR